MTQRTETGRLQFAKDWPGIFIRGDDALSYARILRDLLANANDRMQRVGLSGTEIDDVMEWTKVKELADLLESCRINS